MQDLCKPLTPYGIKIKIKLMELGKKQSWLISEIKSRYPDTYADTSNIYKIQVGEINSGKVIDAINEILGIEKED